MRTPTKTESEMESRTARRKRMVAEMSNGRTFFWVGVALVVHLVIMAATSVPWMREHWFGGKPPAETAAADEGKAPAPATPSADSSNPATPTPAAPTTPVADRTSAAPLPSGVSDDDKKLAERQNSPIVKSVTESDKPSELPKGPRHNGFDIDDSPK